MIRSNAEEIQIPIKQIVVSKTNSRKFYNPKRMEELASSIERHGVLQPILVRMREGTALYELVAGERRYRAAKKLELSMIPAIVRELDDTEVLEIQVVENLEREDLHALEEAEGYRRLLLQKGYDVAKIAARIGRSVKYIYDRVKLLALTEDLKSLFWKGHIDAGHAILLARLKPEDQKRAAELHGGGLFQYERLLFHPDDKREEETQKAVSVRELQGWIDEHVKFIPETDADPILFPAATEAVHSASRYHLGIVPITYDHFIKPDARDGKRVLTIRSWKRADGNKGSKPCPLAATGVLVVGPGRGDAFPVCIQKKKCKVHWASELRAAKQRARPGKKAPSSCELEMQKQEREREKAEAERQRWGKALPAILKAVAQRIGKAPARATGFLGELVVKGVHHSYGFRAPKELPRGRTAEDLVRYAAFLVLSQEANGYMAFRDFPKRAKALGLDVRKIVDQAAPRLKVQTSGKAGRKTRRKKK